MIEIAGDMIRVLCPRKIGLVTGVAIGWCTREAGGMAGTAGRRDVLSRQGEGRMIMVKSCGGPRDRGVAHVARVAEIACDVVRIFSTREIRLVTSVAVGRGTAPETVGVTVNASRRLVLAG